MPSCAAPRPTRTLLTLLVAAVVPCLAAPAGAAASEPPRIVSPGGGSEIGVVDQRCPTFSWVPAPDAASVELVIHRVDDPHRPESAVQVVSVELPGGAHGWTPALGRCLDAGYAYAWTVRAVGEGGAGPWSEPGIFQVVAPRIADTELERALEVVRSYLEQAGAGGGAPVGASAEAGAGAQGAATRPRASATARRSGEIPLMDGLDLSTAVAAIRGELEETSGEVVGVLGVSNSPAGAGVVAANDDSAAAPDLVLEGTTHGATDTVLTQSGIDRPSAADETFDIGNSGVGSMTLTIDGQPLVAGAVDTAELADDAVTGAKIADGAVSAADLATGAVGASQIADGAVSGGNGGAIADKTVDSFDLANDSVGGPQIADGSVQGADIADNTITDADVSIVANLDAAKLADDSVDGEQLADVVTLDAALTLDGQPVTFTDDVAVENELAVTSAHIDTLELRGRSTGTAADGIGTAVAFRTENDAGALVESARIVGRLDSAASGAEASALGFWTGSAGLLQERMSLDADGDVTIQGDLAVNGAFDLPAFSVDTADLANGAVTTLKIASGAVTGGTGGVVEDGTLNSFDLMDGGVEAADLADGAVTGGAGGVIADGTITGDDLQGASIGGAQLQDGSVVGGGGGVIADDTVDHFDLATGAVQADELADGSVDAGAIQSSAVGGVEVADGSLTGADLSPAAGIDDAQVDDDLTVVGGSVDASPVGSIAPDQGFFTFLSSAGNGVVGSATSVSETLEDPAFLMGGDDLFVAGTAGVEGTIYTDGGVRVGAGTEYGDGAITQSAGEGLVIDLDSGDDPSEQLSIAAANVQLSSAGRLSLAETVAFEGATADEFELELGITDPTADRTITLPDASGTIQLAGGDGSFANIVATGTLSLDGGTTTISAAELAPLDGGLDAGEVAGTNAQSLFATIDADSGTDPVADGVADTLQLVAGPGLTVAGDGAGDRVTFSITDDAVDGAQLADVLTLDAALTIGGGDVTLSGQNLAVEKSGPGGGLALTNDTQNGTLNNSPGVSMVSHDASDIQRSIRLQQKLGGGLGQRLSVEADGAEVAWIDDGGKASFDSVEAASRIDTANAVVSSFLRLTPLADGSGPACTGASTGRVYFDSEEGMPCFCDGSSFVRITDAATACTP